MAQITLSLEKTIVFMVAKRQDHPGIGELKLKVKKQIALKVRREVFELIFEYKDCLKAQKAARGHLTQLQNDIQSGRSYTLRRSGFPDRRKAIKQSYLRFSEVQNAFTSAVSFHQRCKTKSDQARFWYSTLQMIEPMNYSAVFRN